VNAKLKVRVPLDEDVVSIIFSSDGRVPYVTAEGSLRGTDALVVYRAVFLVRRRRERTLERRSIGRRSVREKDDLDG
jgi:hypothetical protein